jgi:hypothetical protein
MKSVRTTARREQPLKVHSLKALYQQSFPEPGFLIAPWMREGESAMLYAPTGIGTTMLSLSIGLAVAGGGNLLDWRSPSPRRVLVVDGEMPMWELVRRTRFLSAAIEGIDREAATRNMHFLARQHQHPEASFPDLGTDEGREEVLRRAKAGKFDLIILDNFSTLVDVADENDAAAMSPILAFLMKAKQAGIACLLIHHTGKSGDNYRGSSRLATTFEIIMGLKKPEGERKGTDAEFDLVWDKCRAKRSDETRGKRVWLAEVAGQSQWCFELSQDEELDSLVTAVRSGRFRTQRALGKHLGWDNAKVTRRKQMAIHERRLISRDEWEQCLTDADPDFSDSEVDPADFKM